MISPELIRRYPFFEGLTHDEVITLANIGKEISVEAGYVFFREGDEIHDFYLTMEGSVAIYVAVPKRDTEHAVSDQFARTFETEDVVVSTAGPGQVFAWSALVSPYETSAGAKAQTPCGVILFDGVALRTAMAEDCQFGYKMMTNTARVVRQRLRNMRIESLSAIMAAAVA